MPSTELPLHGSPVTTKVSSTSQRVECTHIYFPHSIVALQLWYCRQSTSQCSSESWASYFSLSCNSWSPCSTVLWNQWMKDRSGYRHHWVTTAKLPSLLYSCSTPASSFLFTSFGQAASQPESKKCEPKSVTAHFTRTGTNEKVIANYLRLNQSHHHYEKPQKLREESW